MNRDKLLTYAWSLALLLVFGLAWEFLPGWFGVPAFVLPPPSQVWSEFVRLWGAERLLWHAGITAFEVVAIVLATIITRELIADGKANWFEGVLLLGVYLILAIGIYHLPE